MVTSAQCVYNLKNQIIPAEKITIFVDGLNRSNLKKFTVAKVIPHKKYDPKTLENDIALLIVSSYFFNILCAVQHIAKQWPRTLQVK